MATAFTVPEAAAITGLDVRAVHKAIENGIVRVEGVRSPTGGVGCPSAN